MSEQTPRARRITLSDVAREAGVSIQTVSHVLSGNVTVRIPEPTREKVRRAAQVVGYRPNPLAQAMKRGTSNVVSLWMPVDRPNPVYMQALRLINSAVRGSGYELMILGLDKDLAYHLEGDAPIVWPVDGIMAFDAGRAVTRLRENATYDSIPVCVIGNELVTNGDSVYWNLRQTAKGITERFLTRGCKRIAHVSMDCLLADYPNEQRRSGYREAMEGFGLNLEYIACAEETLEGAEAACLCWFKAHGVPEAITCMNDTLALGVLHALGSLGVRVPLDCLIWGYGDFPEGHLAPVALSSYRPPIEDLVRIGWQLLQERMSNPGTESRSQMLEMTVYPRASSGD